MAITKAHTLNSFDNLFSCKYVTLFIHYSDHGFIADSFLELNSIAKKIGSYTLLFSPYLKGDSLSTAMTAFDYVAIRENLGRDFGAIKDFYELLRPHRLKTWKFRRLCIFNNSMLQVSKIDSETAWLKDLFKSNYDIFGLTDSFGSGYYHIQTYHYSLSQRLLRSKTFASFIREYDENSTKRKYAIQHGEIKLTQMALNDGYTAGSWFSWKQHVSPNSYKLMHDLSQYLSSLSIPDDLIKRFRKENFPPYYDLAYNPSHFGWAILLLHGYSFVKRELFEINPEETTVNLLMLLVISYLGYSEPANDLNSLQLLLRMRKSFDDPIEHLRSAPPPII